MEDQDIMLNEELFKELVSNGGFTLIQPQTAPRLRLNQFLKCVAVRYDIFVDIADSGRPLTPQDISASQIFFVSTIRECSWRDVTKREWYYNIGPGTPKEWAKAFQPKDSDGQPSADFGVRVCHLIKPQHNLRAFNRQYGDKYREYGR